jgi:hypothetical protein
MLLGAMDPARPRRTPLFADEPVADLRGLAALTDPDERVCAVIDLAVMGARGDGKTRFIVHAIRALHGRAPALAGAEQDLDRQIMRLVLDPRAPRPDATPPGVVPHFTFRVSATRLFDCLSLRGALGLAVRLARVGWLVALAVLLACCGIAIGFARELAPGVVVGASGAAVAAIAALVARARVERAGEIELAFWDVAGEQLFSPGAADYHALLGRLVDARRRRAAAVGRAYAFAPVLVCNPLALGTLDDTSPYARLRALLPVFAAIDRDAARALVAINRWSVVDPICARGAPRDEVVTVSARARDSFAGRDNQALGRYEVARERVRAFCLDAEDGRDGPVAISYVRYDTAIDSAVEVDDDVATIAYDYDDGPGTFDRAAQRRFFDWIARLPRFTPRAANAAVAAPIDEPVAEPALAAAPDGVGAPLPAEVWARPRPR